jgi:hypothetical protein
MKVFKKKDISWQSTVVRFRNGYVGLCINDKVSEDDFDGSMQFMVYDPDTKLFVTSINVDNWDEDLNNTLSLKGILNFIKYENSSGKYKDYDKQMLKDDGWDVIGVTSYPYAHDAFNKLFDPYSWYVRKDGLLVNRFMS